MLFYGGLGGGKKQKGSSLQLGYMIKVQLQKVKRTDDVVRAKDWESIWSYKLISLDHRAFYLACFFMEVIEKIAPEADAFYDDFNEHSDELFNVLSNSLYWLEKSLEEKSFSLETKLFIFLAKLCWNQGVFPQFENCCFCEKELGNERTLFFVGEQGGFSCSECLNQSEQSYPEARQLAAFLKVVSRNSFQGLQELSSISPALNKLMLHYYCEQFQINKNSFKSLALIS